MSNLFEFELSLSEKLTKAKVILYNTYPFWSYISLSLKFKEQGEEFPSYMGIDRKGTINYNEEMMENGEFESNEMMPMIIHEMSHIIFDSWGRRNGRNPDLWNIAEDIKINQTIVEMGLVFPDEVKKFTVWPKDNRIETKQFTIEDLSSKSAEEIYNELEEHTEKIEIALPGESKDDGDSSGKVVLRRWDKHAGESEEDKGMSEEEKDEIRKQWAKRISEAAAYANSHKRGNIPGIAERFLDNVFNPQIRWYKLLKKYIVENIINDFTYRKPSKKSRIAGTYLPDVNSENIEVTAAVDVSGSISQETYDRFISEIYGIAKAYRHVSINILFWDTRVTKDITISRNTIDQLKEIKMDGGGGTTLSCVNKYIDEERLKPKVIVYLTDGYIEDDPAVPLRPNKIFVITKDGTDERLKGKGKIINQKK